MNDIKKLFFDRTDVSDGIDVNETNLLKECSIFHYWYFLNCSFKFATDVIIY